MPVEAAKPVPEALSELGRKRRATDELSDLPEDELERLIGTLEQEMHDAAVDLRFEYAARLRDEVKEFAANSATCAAESPVTTWVRRSLSGRVERGRAIPRRVIVRCLAFVRYRSGSQSDREW